MLHRAVQRFWLSSFLSAIAKCISWDFGHEPGATVMHLLTLHTNANATVHNANTLCACSPMIPGLWKPAPHATRLERRHSPSRSKVYAKKVSFYSESMQIRRPTGCTGSPLIITVAQSFSIDSQKQVARLAFPNSCYVIPMASGGSVRCDVSLLAIGWV